MQWSKISFCSFLAHSEAVASGVTHHFVLLPIFPCLAFIFPHTLCLGISTLKSNIGIMTLFFNPGEHSYTVIFGS